MLFRSVPVSTSAPVAGDASQVNRITGSGNPRLISNLAHDEVKGTIVDSHHPALDHHQNKDKNDHDDSQSDDSADSQDSTARKLRIIERKIRTSNLTKRERRLLQNRKSALKCRIKKQDQQERLRNQIRRLNHLN